MTEYYRLAHLDLDDDSPCLTLEEEGLSATAPTVIVLHGLNGSKESALQDLYAFARRGLRVIALDIGQHGEALGVGTREKDLETHYVQTIFRMVEGTLVRIGRILDRFGLESAGIHGISLGGIVTFAALVKEPRLSVASVAMGSPDWLGMTQGFGIAAGDPILNVLRHYSPLEHAPASYPQRPILMVHGSDDEVVPVEGVQRLHAALLPFYRDVPDRLELVVYPGHPHQYTPDMRARSVSWISRFLNGPA